MPDTRRDGAGPALVQHGSLLASVPLHLGRGSRSFVNHARRARWVTRVLYRRSVCHHPPNRPLC